MDQADQSQPEHRRPETGLNPGGGVHSVSSGVRGVTRLAPSPTGSLHLGNARTFLINWAMACQAGWHITMRVEDLDTPRVKPGAIEQTVDELAWLGLRWDSPARGEPVPVQSTRLNRYRALMQHLARAGLVYRCELTRAELERVVSAPQEGAHETPFPASLRPSNRPRAFEDEAGTATNWRFCVPAEAVTVRDRLLGEVECRPCETVGDFVVWTKRGTPSYQLAVVADDYDAGVTEIVRGDDLVDSGARQLLLWRALGFGPEPMGTHLPLVVGADGRRLAKRHGDTRVAGYRARGVPAERVIGLIAAWSGVLDRRSPEPMDAASFRERFNLGSMSTDAVVMTPEDEAWLTADRTS
jgi:glutamyl-tRNA synthetase